MILMYELFVRYFCLFIQSRQKSTLEHIGRVIQMLMGDFYIPLYLRDDRYLPGYTSTLKGGEFLKGNW